MGWGDEILVTGEVRNLQERDKYKRRVKITDRHGRFRWSRLWDNNPRMAMPHERDEDFAQLRNASFCRPYIDWERMKRDWMQAYPHQGFTTKAIRDVRLPWRFTDHKCSRGEFYFLDLSEKDQGYVIIEPHVKDKSPNRQWGWDRWQQVVKALDYDWVQINPPGARVLEGVKHHPAPSFLDACRHMEGARAYLGPEGGLYHAAAALSVPAVAIFGGFVSPANQGYDDMVNVYKPMGGESPCGQRILCGHCQEAFDRISVEYIISLIEGVVECTM